MRRLRGNLTYANVMATIALFMVLGGSAVAATQIPGDSVGTKQLKKGAVTPSKLSGKTKGLLAQSSGPSGPEGLKGDQGPRGSEGPQGVAGVPGETGSEPLVVAAQGSVADVRGTNAVALSGTTSWTAASGELGLLTGRFTLRLAAVPGEEEDCGADVTIRDNGKEVAHSFAVRHGSAFQEISRTFEPVAIAIEEPGEHTITATTFGGSECAAGSELTSLHLVVAPLGG